MKVLLIVLAALVFLLLCPIGLELHWKDELSVTVRWLFLKFRLLPREKKKKEEPVPAEQAGQAVADARKTAKPGPAETLTQYADMIPELVGRLKDFVLLILRRTRVVKLGVNMLVSREDAAETAIAYGRANQAVYTALGVLQNLMKFGCRPEVSIGFDYLGSREEAEAWAKFRLAPLFVLQGGLGLLLGMLRSLGARTKEETTA